MDYKKIGKSAGRFFLRSLTPIPTLRRQAGQISGSVKRIGEAFTSFKNAGNRPPHPIADDGKPELTPEQKFEKVYEEGGWNEQKLAIHSGKIRVAKFIYLFAAAAMPFAALSQMIAGNPMQSVLGALLLLFGPLGFGLMVLRNAWHDCQIFTRSYMPMKEFIGRGDFWKFMFT